MEGNTTRQERSEGNGRGSTNNCGGSGESRLEGKHNDNDVQVRKEKPCWKTATLDPVFVPRCCCSTVGKLSEDTKKVRKESVGLKHVN
jgi:hypothetical protein